MEYLQNLSYARILPAVMKTRQPCPAAYQILQGAVPDGFLFFNQFGKVGDMTVKY